MNKKRTNCTFWNEQVVPFVWTWKKNTFAITKISLRGHFSPKSVLLRFHCVHLNPFCSECCTDRLIAMQISKWPRKNSINWTDYTYLQNKRMRRCGVAPPPIIFERLKLPQQIIYHRKENLSESPNHQKYWENILVSRFYEQFSRNRRNLGHFRKFEKISNSQNMNILYIILKHVIWRFQIYNLFREIFKFREDKSNNVFREIRKCFRKTAKFEFFAKQIIYLESPDHPLQNDI